MQAKLQMEKIGQLVYFYSIEIFLGEDKVLYFLCLK